MPSIQNGAVTMDVSWFIGLLATLIVISGGFIGFLLKYSLGLHKEQANLKVEISSLKEGKTESLQKIKDLETENLNFKKTIRDKHSDDAILAKYDYHPTTGISYDKTSGDAYCTVCLKTHPIEEVRLKVWNWQNLACSKWSKEHRFSVPENETDRFLKNPNL